MISATVGRVRTQLRLRGLFGDYAPGLRQPDAIDRTALVAIFDTDNDRYVRSSSAAGGSSYAALAVILPSVLDVSQAELSERS
jgi:hypothetical protein